MNQRKKKKKELNMMKKVENEKASEKLKMYEIM